MLALPLITWLFSHNQNYSPFLSWVTIGESLRRNHFITRRARSIITIISTIRIILSRLKWGRRSKSAMTRLSASDATNPSIHLTHVIKNVVKTKISMHMLKMVHNGSKRCLYSRRGRRSRRWRRSRGISNILCNTKSGLIVLSRSRLHMWPLGR